MPAYVLIRSEPWYRREAFVSGLRRLGFDVRIAQPARFQPGDVVVLWNRYGQNHGVACAAEQAGAVVLVAENGYLGEGGSSPKFDVHPGGPKPHHYYALARGWHNGRGWWPNGGRERFDALRVALQPWRNDGDEILICPNRGFGVPPQVMPPDWAEKKLEAFRKIGAKARVRRHPGNDPPKVPLVEDLRRARAVVVWSSGVAVHSLLAGIPTFIDAPFHVLKEAAASGYAMSPALPDRMPAFVRMAWAQWRLDEIESGEPFRWLL